MEKSKKRKLTEMSRRADMRVRSYEEVKELHQLLKAIIPDTYFSCWCDESCFYMQGQDKIWSRKLSLRYDQRKCTISISSGKPDHFHLGKTWMDRPKNRDIADYVEKWWPQILASELFAKQYEHLFPHNCLMIIAKYLGHAS